MTPVTRSVVTALALMMVAASACADPPDERLRQAWAAAEQEDTDTFLLRFTAASAELLRGLSHTKERTRGQLAFVKDMFDVLPQGEVVEVKQRNNMALVTVKGQGDRYDIRMLKERGEWVVDVFALPGLWKPLTAPVDS